MLHKVHLFQQWKMVVVLNWQTFESFVVCRSIFNCLCLYRVVLYDCLLAFILWYWLLGYWVDSQLSAVLDKHIPYKSLFRTSHTTSQLYCKWLQRDITQGYSVSEGTCPTPQVKTSLRGCCVAGFRVFLCNHLQDQHFKDKHTLLVTSKNVSPSLITS